MMDENVFGGGLAPNEVTDQFVLECAAMESEGDGMLMDALLQGKLKYVEATKDWYAWSGHVWMRDDMGRVPGFVRFVTDRYGEAIQHLAEQIPLPEAGEEKRGKSWAEIKINQLQRKIRALRRDSGRAACLKFARDHKDNKLSIRAGLFDRNAWLLGVRNGVIDLRSGMLLPGRPEDMISKQCGCAYDPDVDQRPWRQFVDDITCGDEELARFLQCLIGQALVGEVRERIFPFLLGRRGANGKSKFLNALLNALGNYAGSISNKLFLQNNAPRNSGSADADLMALEGLRLAVASEAPEYAKFDTEQVKRLTGDDRLSGRNPFESRNREFEPTHTCLMVGNDEPVPPTGDQAFWDRVFLIHFNARFVKANPDPARGERLADPLMEEKLMEMGPQILAWAVEGCMQWQTDGCRLRPPKSVLKSTEEYREDADWLGQFLEACCEERPGAQVQAANLHAALALWWAENINDRKNTVPSAQMLGRKMRKLGAYPPDRSTGRAMYQNLALKSVWEQRAQDEDFAY